MAWNPVTGSQLQQQSTQQAAQNPATVQPTQSAPVSAGWQAPPSSIANPYNRATLGGTTYGQGATQGANGSGWYVGGTNGQPLQYVTSDGQTINPGDARALGYTSGNLGPGGLDARRQQQLTDMGYNRNAQGQYQFTDNQGNKSVMSDPSLAFLAARASQGQLAASNQMPLIMQMIGQYSPGGVGFGGTNSTNMYTGAGSATNPPQTGLPPPPPSSAAPPGTAPQPPTNPQMPMPPQPPSGYYPYGGYPPQNQPWNPWGGGMGGGMGGGGGWGNYPMQGGFGTHGGYGGGMGQMGGYGGNPYQQMYGAQVGFWG